MNTLKPPKNSNQAEQVFQRLRSSSWHLDGSWEERHFQFHAALVSDCEANYLLNYWKSL